MNALTDYGGATHHTGLQTISKRRLTEPVAAAYTIGMRRKLTAKTIEALAPNGPKRLEVYDLRLPGFGIRISPNGHKSWFCAARVGDRLRRHTLGPYPRVSLSEAREAARRVMNDARTGAQCEIPDKEAAITLGEVIPQFIEMYAKPKNRNWRGTEALLNQKFIPLFTVPIRSITRPDIVRILDDMVARGTPGRANHAMAAIKKLLNWALNRGMIDVNPIAGLSAPGRKISRDRILQETEIRALLAATEEQGYPFGTIYQLLLYTAQRRGEVSGITLASLADIAAVTPVVTQDELDKPHALALLCPTY